MSAVLDSIIEKAKSGYKHIVLPEGEEERTLKAASELNERKIGKKVKVLCEGFDPVAETCFGRSEADAPEIDGKVYFSAKKRPAEGEFVTVKVTEAIDYDLFGEMC